MFALAIYNYICGVCKVYRPGRVPLVREDRVEGLVEVEEEGRAHPVPEYVAAVLGAVKVRQLQHDVPRLIGEGTAVMAGQELEYAAVGADVWPE